MVSRSGIERILSFVGRAGFVRELAIIEATFGVDRGRARYGIEPT